jgi:hypothetical protein
VSAQQRSGRGPEEGLEEILRRSLRHAGDGFDYDALVAGVHQRAHRIRVRRTVTTLAAAAVLVPAAVASASWLPDVVGGPQEISPADPSQDDGRVVTAPPYQEGEPPLPEGGESTGDVDNGWAVPDARPTGVDLLEEWGAPSDVVHYPRIPVFADVFVCDPEQPGGIEPEAGHRSRYAPGEGQAGSMWESVDIHVTGWADGAQAMQALRDDTLLCAWDVGPDGEGLQREVPWPGHADDPDYYRNEPYLYEGLGDSAWVGVAGVRTGDYIVGVTVRHTDRETADTVAREIAEKTAANLEVLDPEHAGD